MGSQKELESINGTQTEHKSVEKTEHKRSTENNEGVGSQKELESINGTQTEHKSVEKTEHKRNSNNSESFQSLSNNAKKIVLAIYKNMRKIKSDHTEELTIEYLKYLSGVEKNSIKTTLRRLEAQNIVRRVARKDGRGGWVKYTIEQKILDELDT